MATKKPSIKKPKPKAKAKRQAEAELDRFTKGEVQLVKQMPDGRNVYRFWDPQQRIAVYVVGNDTAWATRKLVGRDYVYEPHQVKGGNR